MANRNGVWRPLLPESPTDDQPRGQRRSSLAMLTAELSELEEVGALIEHGRQVGVLMYAAVAQAVSELDLDEADIEKLHRLLEERGIELVEEFDPATAADVQETLDARAGKAETPLDLTPDTTTDSLH